MSSPLARNLKILLERDQVNLSQLSLSSGIDKPRISRMLAGKTTNPQIDTLRPIAEYFGVTLDQLVGDVPLPSKNSYGIIVAINRLLVPVIEWKNIPYWLEIKDHYRPSLTIDARCSISNDSYGLKILDEKFSPRFNQGTLIIVDPKAENCDGDYIIVKTHNSNEFAIQQILKGKQGAFLKDFSKLDALKKAPADFICYGVIVEAHIKMNHI